MENSEHQNISVVRDGKEKSWYNLNLIIMVCLQTGTQEKEDLVKDVILISFGVMFTKE